MLFHELFSIICFQYRLCTVGYFLDEMSLYELNDIIPNLKFLDRNNWEQTRMIAYIIAQVNSTKELDMNDIATFPWDKDHKKDIEITSDQIKEMNAKMKIIQQAMYNNDRPNIEFR